MKPEAAMHFGTVYITVFMFHVPVDYSNNKKKYHGFYAAYEQRFFSPIYRARQKVSSDFCHFLSNRSEYLKRNLLPVLPPVSPVCNDVTMPRGTLNDRNHLR